MYQSHAAAKQALAPFQLHPEADAPLCGQDVELHCIRPLRAVYRNDRPLPHDGMAHAVARPKGNLLVRRSKQAFARFDMPERIPKKARIRFAVPQKQGLINVEEEAGRIAERTVKIPSFGFR